jgi:hypothetical protein
MNTSVTCSAEKGCSRRKKHRCQNAVIASCITEKRSPLLHVISKAEEDVAPNHISGVSSLPFPLFVTYSADKQFIQCRIYG